MHVVKDPHKICRRGISAPCMPGFLAWKYLQWIERNGGKKSEWDNKKICGLKTEIGREHDNPLLLY